MPFAQHLISGSLQRTCAGHDVLAIAAAAVNVADCNTHDQLKAWAKEWGAAGITKNETTRIALGRAAEEAADCRMQPLARRRIVAGILRDSLSGW